MEFASRRIGDVLVAVPTGRLDHASAIALESSLAPLLAQATAAKSPLVLDFAGVEYISSMGLRVLMVAAKQMSAHGARIGVAGLQPVVEEIFQIARFRYVMPVFPTLRAALWELSPRAAEVYDRSPR